MTPTTSDRVLETTATTGTGAFALLGPAAGYRSFLSGVGNGAACYYCAEAVDGAGVPTGDWEVGTGTLSGGVTLSRSAVLASSNGGSAVNFAAGTKRVFAALPLELLTRFALLDAANTFTASQVVSGGTVTADDFIVTGGTYSFGPSGLFSPTITVGGGAVTVSDTGTVTATTFVGGGTSLTGVALLSGGNSFSGTQAVTGAVSATTTLSVTSGGKTLTTSGTTTLTTNDTELVLACTGDTLGTTELHLRNRSGQAGPLFKSLSQDVIDFSFQGQTAAVRGIRYEGRGANAFVAAPEFQFGVQGFPSLVNADGGTWFVGYNRANPVTLSVRNNSTTTFQRDLYDVTATWVDSTDATRKARVQHLVYDTASREYLRGEASGTAPMIGFLGNAAVVRPTVTGSKGANAALASLLTALATLGLVTDSTT